MKSVSPVLAFVALLAFATLTSAQEKSAEQAVEN
jgi:hypothetical protein